MMKKTFIVGICCLVVSLFSSICPARAEGKIAVVNLQKALNEVNEGKRAMAQIQADIDVKKKQLDSLKDTIKKMRDDLEKEKMVLAKEALEKKASEIQTKLLELQQKAMEYDQELKKKESDSVQAILTALRTMVIELAKSEKYDMVYENSADVILYSANAQDITQNLIKTYNLKRK